VAISTFFLVRSPRYARNDNFPYEIATLPSGARNDFVTTLIAFILVPICRTASGICGLSGEITFLIY